jgi:hypothetical protein
MVELIGATIGTLLGTVLVCAVVLWPLFIVLLLVRFSRDMRRIASSLERMEERQLITLASTPPPATLAPLEVLSGRAVVNSMFGR